jgi:hypothetical protein
MIYKKLEACWHYSCVLIGVVSKEKKCGQAFSAASNVFFGEIYDQ